VLDSTQQRGEKKGENTKNKTSKTNIITNLNTQFSPLHRKQRDNELLFNKNNFTNNRNRQLSNLNEHDITNIESRLQSRYQHDIAPRSQCTYTKSFQPLSKDSFNPKSQTFEARKRCRNLHSTSSQL
jgi:hypothetical protein